MQLQKRDVEQLLQEKRKTARNATAKEKERLQTQFVKLMQMYKEANQQQMKEEMKKRLHSFERLNVKVVSEDEHTLLFTVEQEEGQSYAETFFCIVDK